MGNRETEVRHAANGDTVRTYTTPTASQPQSHALAQIDQTRPDGTRLEQYELRRRLSLLHGQMGKMVVRRPLFQIPMWLFSAFSFFPGILMLAEASSPWQMFFGSGILACVLVFLWLIGWHSRVRVDEQSVTIVNGFSYSRIPWCHVESVEQNGCFMVRLSSGEEIGSVQYGGSLIGELTGYLTHRRLVRIAKKYLESSRLLPRSEGEPDPLLGKLRIPVIGISVVIGSYTGFFTFLGFLKTL